MKFSFKIQPFQSEAVGAVLRVFNGQSKQECISYRRDVAKPVRAVLFDDEEADTGYCNAAIELSDEQLLKNIREIQTANHLNLSPTLLKALGAVSLDVEMETGTGKTYVYTKTMFELHKRYGWSKYIVVVPSVAIREGVKKSFEMTQEHFMELYGIKARFFVYNSSNLHQLDEFSSGFGINVIIINIQAFATSLKEDGRSKESRIIYSKRDEFGSRRPIDVIKANRPIVILDEPQKMGGTATQTALKNNFNPLFSLNYSATHKTSHNLVYVLDALDAFQKKLVKKIEVKGFEIKNLRGTDGYLYLTEIVLDRKKPPRARLEFEVKHKSGIQREMRLLGEGDSLYAASNELEQYKGIFIANVDPLQGMVAFSNGETLSAGSASGNINESDIRRIQIRETICSHLAKEEKLFQQGIKCLSLFFIDEVAKYRQYGEGGVELLGEYGKMFEQEYVDALNERRTLFQSEYQEYLQKIEVYTTHRGYFSIDKQGGKERFVNSTVKRGSEFSDDISAYNLILKNKEQLLSFEEPTRFIFSHSALREGWDNPNVFQICTLKHSDNATAKRQEVGRGLRLCVNQSGDRQDMDMCGETLVHDINKLTVIASESYAGFVADLQSKIREDLYERPTKASIAYFTGKTFMVNGEVHTLSAQEATVVYNHLVRNNYVDDNGAITSEYRTAAESGQLAPLKDNLAPLADGIHTLVQAIFEPSVLEDIIEDGHETKVKDNPLNDNFYKQEFQGLWNAINGRYAYTVEFDSPELIEKSIAALNAGLHVAKLQYTLTEGVQTGVDFDVSRTQTRTLKHTENSAVPYDFVGKIAAGTTLTRRTAAAILKGLCQKKLYMFRLNPEEFIQRVVEEINRQKAAVVVEHISYQPSAESPYTQGIFNMSKSSQEYAKAFKAKKAIQDYVFTDGMTANSIERTFAEDVDAADEVVVYAKLPRGPKGFYIPTPVGNYSPDWAIAFKRGAVKHLFFIAETKGTLDSLHLRPIEQAKILCAQKLFNEFSTSGVQYHNVDSYKHLLEVMQTL
ncbi:MAG: DEAD/DEAH box helicase family protein [Proteobacteria bacterium]|nr:DEAD/DEAH box helicase family protein [Cystobacterineae bacterium]MCL2258958.1 DEAD/DEAH box helicase family protein [Cystobacterineae bacterium]MCL2314884.1 DEAD/DEAH box helicase family protein [Pseudomonadota bacterium]